MSGLDSADKSAREDQLVGTCDRCLRERTDLFQHPDGNRYCSHVFVCEARYEIQGRWEERGKETQAARRAASTEAGWAKRELERSCAEAETFTPARAREAGAS